MNRYRWLGIGSTDANQLAEEEEDEEARSSRVTMIQ